MTETTPATCLHGRPVLELCAECIGTRLQAILALQKERPELYPLIGRIRFGLERLENELRNVEVLLLKPPPDFEELRRQGHARTCGVFAWDPLAHRWGGCGCGVWKGPAIARVR